MLNLNQLLLSIGAFQGLLLTFLLLITPNKSSASKILATFCFFLFVNFVTQNLYQQNNYVDYPQLIGLTEFLAASYGALLYLYLYSALTGEGVRRVQWLHFTPIVLCYLLALPQLFSAPQQKIELVEAIMNGQPIPLNFYIALKIVFVQAFAYGGLSLWFLLNHYRRAQQNLSTFNGPMIIWLAVFISLYTIIWLFKSFSLYTWVGDVFIILMISAIAIVQWRNPDLFKTSIPAQVLGTSKPLEPSISESSNMKPSQVFGEEVSNEQDIHENLLNVHVKSEDGKYGEARLPTDLLKTMATQANDLMINQKPYIDSQLTLNELAGKLGYSTHHLSQVVNLSEGKNFYQWVNQYRVNEVISKLTQSPEAKVLDIALECGFSSKSSFNSVFKKYTQMTPTEYRNSIIKV